MARECKHEWEYLDAYGDWYEGQYTRKCKKCGLVEDVEYEGDWEWKRTWYEKEREEVPALGRTFLEHNFVDIDELFRADEVLEERRCEGRG